MIEGLQVGRHRRHPLGARSAGQRGQAPALRRGLRGRHRARDAARRGAAAGPFRRRRPAHRAARHDAAARRNPRPCHPVASPVGAPADLILFDPDYPWVVAESDIVSRSRNTAFEGARLQGAVMQTFVAGRSVFRHARWTEGAQMIAVCARDRHRLSARLDPVRPADHPGGRARRRAQDRLGQYRRDQCAAHRPARLAALTLVLDAAKGAAAVLIARRSRGCAARPSNPTAVDPALRVRRLPRPLLPGLARLQGRQGRRRPSSACCWALSWPVGLIFCAVWLLIAFAQTLLVACGPDRGGDRADLRLCRLARGCALDGTEFAATAPSGCVLIFNHRANIGRLLQRHRTQDRLGKESPRARLMAKAAGTSLTPVTKASPGCG